MGWSSWALVLVLGSSFIPGVLIFSLPEERHRARVILNMAGATLKLALVTEIFTGVFRGRAYQARLAIAPGLELLLRVDRISLLFVSLSAVLWLLTTIYAIGYLEGSPRRSRFFGFFSLCVTATMGIALAGNLFTFFVFYETLTVVTYPLVVHRESAAALRAGRTYLAYTLSGGALLLVGVVWLQAIAGPVQFDPAGALGEVARTHRGELIAVFALLILGLGVKAALVPLHGWLPEAMVAPAPVSALLHAVAVVKAGAFGIVRVVYDVYGIELARAMGLLPPLAAATAFTILYGSVRALAQDDLKRRLAFSTVSQVSYITLGAAIYGATATAGGLAHLVHQGLMKITLFFCAGNLAETLGIHKISELNGVGRRMPMTMLAFTLAALGMIGAPPLAGFVSKWHLGLGGVERGWSWVVPVLLASTLLNAAYFLPIIRAAWFRQPDGAWRDRIDGGRLETRWTLLAPALITAGLATAAGLLAGASLSPLGVAWFVTREIYEAPP